jgi:hypothetical protein
LRPGRYQFSVPVNCARSASVSLAVMMGIFRFE